MRLRGRREASVVDRPERARLELAELYASGDYSSALALAEKLQARGPDELAAAAYARDCRIMLEKEYLMHTGSLDGVPVLAISGNELRGRNLDHRAGFLLSRVDGQSSFEELLDVGAMPRVDALRILAELVQQGILRRS